MCVSCCLALKAGIYRADRRYRLPALDSRAFLWTLLPDSNALESSPANFTHCRWESPGGNSNSSPIKAMALVLAIPLMPTGNTKTLASSGCLLINARAWAAKASIRFSNWLMASLASRSTALGVSPVATKACKWFLAAAF